MQKPGDLAEGGLLTEYETKPSVERKMVKSDVLDIRCFSPLTCVFEGRPDILLGTNSSPTVSSSSETISPCSCLPQEHRKDTQAAMRFLFSGLYFRIKIDRKTKTKKQKKKKLRLTHPRCRTWIYP